MNSSRMLSLGVLGIALLITVPPKLSDYEALEIRLDHAVEEASTALLERRDYELKVENRSGYFEIDAHGHTALRADQIYRPCTEDRFYFGHARALRVIIK